MTKQIKSSYDIDLASIRRILASIIRDEETHMELLEDIKEIYAKRKEKLTYTGCESPKSRTLDQTDAFRSVTDLGLPHSSI